MPSIITVGPNINVPDAAENKTIAPATSLGPTPAQRSIVAGPKPEPVTMRAFGDSNATREAIYANVMKAAQSIQPVSNSRYTLSLHNPQWADNPDVSIPDRKKAVLRGETLNRRLRGLWRLTDTQGAVLGERLATVAHVPRMTNQGTFVINGSEYTLGHQMRLRPGVFTRRKENGELESHINIMPGKGLSHHYFLEPETGVFKIRVGQANMPLISVMKAMGVSDKEMSDAWGSELHGINMQKDDPRAIDKLYARLIGKKGDPQASMDQKREAVAKAFNDMELDPEVTKRTLGQPFHKLSKEVALATTKKLLAVSRGEADTDDRDALAFQHFMGPEDLFAERIGRDKRVMNEMLWKASTHGNLEKLPTGAFTSHVHAALLDSGLGLALEEINPTDVFDQQTRVSRLGFGGIPSIESVPDEARSVQPSHLGFIDLLRTPECEDAISEVFTSYGWKAWPDVTAEDKIACLIDDRMEFHKPLKLISEDYAGPMYCGVTEFLNFCVTPNHRHYIQKAGRSSSYVFETADKTFHKSCRWFKTGHLPFVGDSRLLQKPIECSDEDWAELVGWYLSEGCCMSHGVHISQTFSVNLANCLRLEQLFNKIDVNWTKLKSGKGYNINSTKLRDYFKQFGFCYDKWIPEELLTSAETVRTRLFESLLLGDGRRSHNKSDKGQLVQFCTSSAKLSDCFERLAISLGKPCRTVFEKDERQSHYLGCYVTHLHQRIARHITRFSSWTGEPYHRVINYSGKVYCVQVPGGIFYTRRNGSVGYWTGNSLKAGVDNRVSFVAKKGSDGRIYTPFLDPKSGQMVYRSPQDVADLTLAFPGEMEKGKPLVAAMVGSKTRYVPRDQVNLVMPHAEHWFSPINNLVPMKSAVQGQRASMASRFITQALPLKDAESPFVRGQVPGAPGRSFEEHYGHYVGAVFSEKQAGRVVKVSPDSISVKYADGSTKEHELFRNFPYNRKTQIHNTPLVQAGDPVAPGQLLAKSNYTDDKGHIALGKNLRVAYVPFRGLNYEDAYVISESAADKLSSEHLYQHNMEWEEKHRRGLNSFVSIFPGVFEKKQLGGMDSDGVVKPGTVIRPGDPVILAAREHELSRKQVHAAHKGSFVNDSVTWDHHVEGMVTDVEKTEKGVTVAVTSMSKMQVGDKMSGRAADKGVVADIIPDEQMPHDQEGRPFEVLANPLGIISRRNPAQTVEATLGAIAEKTGKYYAIDDFSNIEDLNEYAIKERQKYGINNYGSINDPTTNKKIDNVFTGNRYFMKLHHTAASKGQGRGLGGYTAESMPAKGGAEGSKRMATMDINAMLSHGAIETLRDVKLIRGQKNQEYWSNFMQGNRPPTPNVPLVYEKFVNQLKASGINVQREGSRTHLMEITNKDVVELAGDRELTGGADGKLGTVDWKTGLTPIKGGLFDEKLTGGHTGNRWAKITLHEPMPNPVMEEPIRRLLGLTHEKFNGVIAGTDELGGKTGPVAIQNALASIDLNKSIQQARADVASGKKTLRDNAVRKLQYLKSAQMKGIHPKDWMMNAVPVLPPMFRPISIMQQTGGRFITDANYLYKELFDANNALKNVSGISEDVGDERLNLYNAFKGVTGLGDPIRQKNQDKKIKGFLQHVFGTSPKFGTVQQKLIGTTVDLVGRAVVVPNPDLNMDEVGLPEARAWEIYTPFITRRLVKRGVPRVQALEYINNKHDVAKKAMLEEINERPIIVTRAPTLHRYGLMAFWPKLTKGETLQISPIVVGGFGMDFDGDASNYHVPASDEAREEAVNKLMPSKNLLSTQKFQAHYLPRQEYQGGLWAATSAKKEGVQPRVFATKQDALRAFHRGEINPDHPIHIVNAEK